MKRLRAVVIATALLSATSAVASADTITPWQGTRQQAMEYVIARGLAQRGVPYVYGGGNPSGPTSGVRTDSTPALTAPSALSLGAPLDPVPAAAPLAPAAAPVATPNPGVPGFDSSGLIQYAFAGVGIKLPRSSGQQYLVGRKVGPAEARRGDLIFYGPNGSQSVAMLLGNGYMLEATPPAVTVSPVRTDGMSPYLSRIIDY
jgi:cell wall-associated NlpC family hydrolase